MAAFFFTILVLVAQGAEGLASSVVAVAEALSVVEQEMKSVGAVAEASSVDQTSLVVAGMVLALGARVPRSQVSSRTWNCHSSRRTSCIPC